MVAHLHGVQGVAGSNPAVPTNYFSDMSIDKSLLDILACPLCKGKLFYNRHKQELICRFDKLAFPIEEGIPVILESASRQLTEKEDFNGI